MLNIDSSYRNFQTQQNIKFKALLDENNEPHATTNVNEKSSSKLSIQKPDELSLSDNIKTTYQKDIKTDKFTSKERKRELKSIVNKLVQVGGLSIIAIASLKFTQLRHKVAKHLKRPIAEHIDFKPADNLDKAIKYACDNFDIKLERMPNLEIANFINEILVDIVNKTKGKVFLPSKIKVAKVKDGYAGFYNGITNEIVLSKKQFDYLHNKGYRGWAQLPLNGQRNTLYHEMGHCQHVNQVGFFKHLAKPKGFKDFVARNEIELDKLLLQYLNKDTLHYYKKSHRELFAQIWASKLQGIAIPKEVDELFNMICGKSK